jgi:hypothetical protein
MPALGVRKISDLWGFAQTASDHRRIRARDWFEVFSPVSVRIKCFIRALFSVAVLAIVFAAASLVCFVRALFAIAKQILVVQLTRGSSIRIEVWELRCQNSQARVHFLSMHKLQVGRKQIYPLQVYQAVERQHASLDILLLTCHRCQRTAFYSEQ